MKKVLALSCLCGMIFSGAPQAQGLVAPITLEELLDRLQAREESIHDIQFDFEQKLFVQAAEKEERCQGRAFFKLPGHFKIERANLHHQIFICDGKKLWVYTPEFKQVLVATWRGWNRTRELPPGFFHFEKYVDHLKKNFSMSLENSGSEGLYLLVAEPKDKNAENYTLRLWIDPLEFLPVQTEFKSRALLVRTKITRSVVNKGLAEELFKFRKAADVETVPLS